MNRFAAETRLILFIAAAVWLGFIVQRNPDQLTLSLPQRGISVTAPRSLEGWQLYPGQGDVLVTGHSRLNLMTLEIAEVPVPKGGDLDSYMEQRHAEVRQGKEAYIVWHKGTDAKFGLRPAPAYKATYMHRFAGLPIKAEFWLNEVYWPYQGRYVRISMRYPDLLSRYVEPDRYMLAAGLKLAR